MVMLVVVMADVVVVTEWLRALGASGDRAQTGSMAVAMPVVVVTTVWVWGVRGHDWNAAREESFAEAERSRGRGTFISRGSPAALTPCLSSIALVTTPVIASRALPLHQGLSVTNHIAKTLLVRAGPRSGFRMKTDFGGPDGRAVREPGGPAATDLSGDPCPPGMGVPVAHLPPPAPSGLGAALANQALPIAPILGRTPGGQAPSPPSAGLEGAEPSRGLYRGLYRPVWAWARPPSARVPRHRFPLGAVGRPGRRRGAGARETTLREGTCGLRGPGCAAAGAEPVLGAPLRRPRGEGRAVPGRAAEAPGGDPDSARLSPAAPPHFNLGKINALAASAAPRPLSGLTRVSRPRARVPVSGPRGRRRRAWPAGEGAPTKARARDAAGGAPLGAGTCAALPRPPGPLPGPCGRSLSTAESKAGPPGATPGLRTSHPAEAPAPKVSAGRPCRDPCARCVPASSPSPAVPRACHPRLSRPGSVVRRTPPSCTVTSRQLGLSFCPGLPPPEPGVSLPPPHLPTRDTDGGEKPGGPGPEGERGERPGGSEKGGAPSRLGLFLIGLPGHGRAAGGGQGWAGIRAQGPIHRPGSVQWLLVAKGLPALTLQGLLPWVLEYVAAFWESCFPRGPEDLQVDDGRDIQGLPAPGIQREGHPQGVPLSRLHQKRGTRAEMPPAPLEGEAAVRVGSHGLVGADLLDQSSAVVLGPSPTLPDSTGGPALISRQPQAHSFVRVGQPCRGGRDTKGRPPRAWGLPLQGHRAADSVPCVPPSISASPPPQLNLNSEPCLPPSAWGPPVTPCAPRAAGPQWEPLLHHPTGPKRAGLSPNRELSATCISKSQGPKSRGPALELHSSGASSQPEATSGHSALGAASVSPGASPGRQLQGALWPWDKAAFWSKAFLGLRFPS
ncbi:collagen alpha-1(I) chain-like [Moschus berezovskii]|uniref:collagen alpha-1(I) chain-like n=1 Tax=Moschus berezovskii TaxID=68408 RepID=UPI0024450D8F|nr:collagen alpha-1(I) chain-like [Moschus berezovskii]